MSRLYRLFFFVIQKIRTQQIHKVYKSTPDNIVQHKLACQNFSPVAEDMGMYHDEPVVELIVGYRCSECADQDKTKGPYQEHSFFQVN
jgi:hypothetical protein